MQYKIIDNTESFEAFRALLRASNLPDDDINFHRDLLIGYFENDKLVGTGALEIYEQFGLLRSMSVRLDIRGKSVGSAIVQYLLKEAKHRNLTSIFLLTETAHDFFIRKGFEDISRDEVPDVVKTSTEFSHVCPVSAAVMRLTLK